MTHRFIYLFTSGKNSKFAYYMQCYIRQCLPRYFARKKRDNLLQSIAKRSDREEIIYRINYYNRMQESSLPQDMPMLKEFKIPRKGKVYYFDSYEYIRYFPRSFRWNICPGDITFVPKCQSIVKSRLLVEHNENSILLNMDKVRHFIFVDDKKKFADKLNKVIFRGKINGKHNRELFMQIYFGNPLCDVGIVGENTSGYEEWKTEKKTIRQHLDYKYIMALEGNDVASNLKWIMSSNSIAVMPRPSCETWFMEGTLIPDYHYIEIKSDFSDLEERINYYSTHLQEAEEIIRHANEYVDRFKNKNREKLIALGVMEKYFRKTGQL